MNRLSSLSIPKIIALSFFSVILVGSFLLNLSISQLSTSTATYWDHLFISVSSVCVTGLYTSAVSETYNRLGQTIQLIMIQIGGLGLMTLFSYFLIRLNRRMDYRSKKAIVSAINYNNIGDSSDFIKKIIKYTIVIEGAGALLLSFAFIPRLGLKDGLFTSIYLSISAFCNAGFDPLSPTSLIAYNTNYLINITVTLLIILGGIGFGVWFDVTDGLKKRFNPLINKVRSPRDIWNNLRSHTKMAIGVSLALILFGTFSVLLIEWNNPGTLGGHHIFDKVLISYFQSVSMRTAGFATIDYTLARPASFSIWNILMFIGGSPGGAAGGIKTTTFAILILLITRNLRNQEKINFDHHSIPDETVRAAFIISISYLLALIIAVFGLLIFDETVSLNFLIFEAISALATVGVSANLTPTLSHASQFILMILMFGGRIGPLTLLTSLVPSAGDSKKEIRRSETNILVG